MRTWLSILVALGCLPAVAQGDTYRFDTDIRQAYQLVLSLRLAEAGTQTALIKRQQPDNLLVHLIEDYIDFFTVYVSEDERAYERLKPNRAKRLELLETGDVASPYYLYSQAEIHLHWALLRLRFEDYLGAFTDINRANKLLKRNQVRFPDFMPNLKDLGVLHAAVSTVPDNLRWGVELLSSLKGDLALGRQQLQTVLRYADSHPEFPFADETRALNAYVLLHLENKPAAAWNAVQRAGYRPAANPLHSFLLANIAMRTGHNDAALRYLEQRPRGAQYLAFPYLDYMVGMAHLRRLEPTQARPAFARFLQAWQGRHFRRETWQKLAWCALLTGDAAGYSGYLQRINEEAVSTAGGDNDATLEAAAQRAPHTALLQARLLFDGGYYERGRAILQRVDPQSLSEARDQLEYTYRMGRLLDGAGLTQAALDYYEQTIRAGSEARYYFACNAALRAGMLHEQRGDKAAARRYYELCLSLKPDAYRTGLHQQAKAGLSRL